MVHTIEDWERQRQRERGRERETLTAAWIYEVCGRQPPPWQVWWPDSGSCGCHSRNRSAQSHTPLAEVREQRRGGNGERKNTNYRTHENTCRFNQQPCTLRHHLAWNVFQSQKTPGIKWFQSISSSVLNLQVAMDLGTGSDISHTESCSLWTLQSLPPPPRPSHHPG